MANINIYGSSIYFIFVPPKDSKNRDLQVQRKAIVLEILCCFVIFFILMLIETIKTYKGKGNDDGKRIDLAGNPQPGPAKPEQNVVESANKNATFTYFDKKKQQERFVIFLSNHIICAGFAILYSPYGAQVAFSYLNLGAFVGYCVFQKLDKNPMIKQGIYGFCCAVNLFLLFSAMIELGKIRDSIVKL